MLHLAHWLGSRSSQVERLRERWQFCIVLCVNPDGAAHGNWVLNARGEVPMAGFAAVAAGEPAAAESEALWRYYTALRP